MSKKKDSLKPWLSRPAVNRSVTLPLTRPLTQRLSNLNEFHPNELDPYLLFDARDSMIGTLENPTLDLDPSKPDTLNVITATRSGTATYTDVNGNIAAAAADTVRVDYTQGEELTPTKYQRIENTDFSSWSHARTSGTANAAISPDGQNNATYVEQNAGQTNAGSIYRFDAAFTGVFTLSVYAKKKEKDFVVLYDSNVGRTYFNLDTGTVGTIAAGNTANIEDAGNGWFRCSTTFTASSGTVKAFYVGDNDNNSVVTDSGGIYVWGPQLEEGTTASDFVENTTGSPKFITGATYGPRVPMILVEPSATNLLTYSEDFSQWNQTRCSLGEQIEAPDGSITGYKIIPNTESAKHEISTTTGAYTDATVSVFAKAGEQSRLQITKSLWGTTDFDLLAGTVTSGTGTIEDVGNGWFRCTASYVASPSQSSIFIIVANDAGNVIYEGDGVSGLYLWGAQVEAGSVATSYIPTSGSTVTRQADDLVISGSDFTDFYNQSEGTVYIELTSKDDGRNSYPVYFTQNGAGFAYRNNGTWAIQKDGIPIMYLASWANGGFVSNSLITLGSYTAGDLTRVSVSYDSNSYEGSKDGASVATSTPTTMATTLVDRLYVGGSADFQNSSRIKRLIYWPYSSDNL